MDSYVERERLWTMNLIMAGCLLLFRLFAQASQRVWAAATVNAFHSILASRSAVYHIKLQQNQLLA